MQIEHLQLAGYRNYSHLDLPIRSRLCIFVGANAQGKTNLLESIYYAATGRSFRAGADEELVAWGADEAAIRCAVARESGQTNIDIRIARRGGKRILINGQPLRRQADIFGYLNAIVFTPDDLQMVKGGPGERRRFLDIELAQVSATYRHDLTTYYRILKQRNRLLLAIAEKSASADSLSVWDEQLLAAGCRVIVKRAEAAGRLAALGAGIHAAITSGQEELLITYRPFFTGTELAAGDWRSPAEVQERFLAAMQRLRRAEMARGQSLVGPQRDDLQFCIAGRDIRSFGSQGQQRTAVLACKLAELEFMRLETGEYPVLLLDDVLSELDQQRRQYFLQVVTERVQTFITTTSLHSFSAEFLAGAQVAAIECGKVS